MTKPMILNMPVAASTTLEHRDAVVMSSGAAIKVTDTGGVVLGFAQTDVDNSSGSAGDKYIGVTTDGLMVLNSYVGDLDAAGLFSSPIEIGDALTVAVIAGETYVVKNAFAASTSIVVGYAMEANAGSTSAATVAAIVVALVSPKTDGAALV